MRTGKEDPLAVHFGHCTSGLAECSPIGSREHSGQSWVPVDPASPEPVENSKLSQQSHPQDPSRGYILGFFFLFYKRDPSPRGTHLLCGGLTRTTGDALLGSPWCVICMEGGTGHG